MLPPARHSRDELHELARQGDASAVRELLDCHRARLLQMVRVRMDQRLRARLDPSDVVQESLIEASRRLPAWLGDPAVPLYPWLRQIAWEKLVELHRRHVRRQKRSVVREVRLEMRLSDDSIAGLSQIVASQPGPSEQVVRAETQRRVREALERLNEGHREVLVMRYVEQMTSPEIAAALGISEKAVRMRHLRALETLRRRLGPSDSQGSC